MRSIGALSAIGALGAPAGYPSFLTPPDDPTAAARAYTAALAKLAPLWNPLPIGPYPPASDTTNFPRTGTPGLTITKAQVTADQLAEPGRITKALADESAARVPRLNLAFVIGLGCVAGYFILRD